MSEAVNSSATGSALLPVTGLFQKAWVAYRSRAKAIILTMLLGMLVIAAAAFLSMGPAALLPYQAVLMLSAIGGTLLQLAVVFLVQAAVLFAASSRGLGVKASFKASWKGLFGFIWVTLLWGFVVSGGYLLLVVPGIIVSVLTYFSFFAFVNEDKRGMAALTASWSYVRGRWWAVFGRVFLLMVLYALVVGGPFQAIALQFSDPFSPPANPMLLGLTAIALVAAAVFVVLPYMLVFMNELYEDLRGTMLQAPVGFDKRTRSRAIWVGAAGNVLLIVLLAVAIGFPEYQAMQDRQRDRKLGQITELIMTRDMEAVEAFVSENPGLLQDGSALLIAIEYAVPDIVRMLVEKGADPTSINTTIFSWGESASIEKVEIMRTLIDRGINVNLTDDRGTTALMIAARNYNADTVSQLIAAGADVNARSSDGDTPIIFAAYSGDIDIARVLIEAGADVYATNNMGFSALSIAAQSYNTELLNLLSEAEEIK